MDSTSDTDVGGEASAGGAAGQGASAAIPDSEQEAFRASWERFASLYTQAMTQPEVRAIPEVHAVLDLLGDAVLALAADIHQTRWPPAQYGSQELGS